MKTYAIIGTVILLVWVGLVAVLEYEFVLSLYPLFYLFMMTGPVLAVVGLLLIIQRKWLRICFLLPLVPLIILPFLDITPVKSYKKFYRSLHVGMNEAQVDDMLVKFFPEGGKYKLPVKNGQGSEEILFILDPNDGAFNAELVELKMENGQLSAKEYLPD